MTGIIIGFFLVLALLVLLPSYQSQNKWLHLFRVLFPSWSFFTKPVKRPVLFHRTGQGPESLGPWTPTLAQQKRTPWQWLFNPQGNLRLAHHNHLQHLLSDLAQLHPEDTTDFKNTSSYRITKELVQSLSQDENTTLGSSYQFKLCLNDPLERHLPQEEILVSPVYERDL